MPLLTLGEKKLYRTKILCLANSRKPPSGRCIAGKVLVDGNIGEWLRPVSDRPSHEVSEEERRYESGTKVQLLDIVSVPLDRASPSGHQIENHVIDTKYYWTKEGVGTWAQVQAAADPYDQAFWSNSQSTYHGSNDKVAEADVHKTGSSLKLILVPALELHVRLEDGYGGSQGRRRVRAKFQYNSIHYLLSVTDPEISEKYLTSGDGCYEHGKAALCISLVEVWNGFAFRVVASVLTPERCQILNA